jgi:hypothetical protein
MGDEEAPPDDIIRELLAAAAELEMAAKDDHGRDDSTSELLMPALDIMALVVLPAKAVLELAPKPTLDTIENIAAEELEPMPLATIAPHTLMLLL